MEKGVTQRESVSHVHHHDQTHDLRRAVEISERVAHAMKLPPPASVRMWSDAAVMMSRYTHSGLRHRPTRRDRPQALHTRPPNPDVPVMTIDGRVTVAGR
jgi:hypothetical protein